MKFKNNIVLLVISLLILNACATYKAQYKNEEKDKTFPQEAEIEHSFYLIGDGGNSPIGTKTKALIDFQSELTNASKNSTALFLGDNIYPSGMPDKKNDGRAFAEHQLNVQTEAAKDFKGRTIFIPGNHDWYSDGLEGLKRQEKYIEDKLGKNTFLPENGCPIKKVNISDNIVLIIIDSQWYLADWDKHPTINDDCEFKTRVQFFDEYESLLKKNRSKTTIVALHHPMFTNGTHGGQYGMEQHLFPTGGKVPLPVLGSLATFIRKTGGVSTTDNQNKKYREFQKRMVTLSQENENVIFVSGHDHNLQYIVEDNLPQIISGSGSKTNPTRNVDGGQFSYGTQGYARLDVFKDGSSYVRFYEAGTEKLVFETQVLKPNPVEELKDYPEDFPSEVTASIYSEEETNKSKSYKKFWGERYRKYFGTNVSAPTVNLDTLFGGLKPVRKGGGNQSKSLRLEDTDGREYVMRALRKNAVQYLQAVAFKDQYIKGQFDDTYTEDLLLDVFTGSHPYAPFTIATLADAVGVMHTNPVLYYIPKQNALGVYNNEFGDELYMIEERAADGHGEKASFGFSNELISTHDMLKELRKDEDNILDEQAYVRARLFDMLIGDWDRHEDQWRWAKFKENGKTIYRPMPRDRDQAYSIMADGSLLKFATSVIPDLRLMKSYDQELKSPKWFNLEPYPLDVALINQATKTDWDEQVVHITTNLTNEVIDEAFTFFPEEVSDETVNIIKNKLKGRRANLQKIADSYFKNVNKYAVVKGTDKDDLFEIERINNTTKVTGYRIQKGEKGEKFHEREYTKASTKEIWIYGLDDDDVFKVFGDGTELIKVRIVGGQNKDTYNIENGSKVKVYDYKSKKSEFITSKGQKKLTDNYDVNIYDYKKPKYNSNMLIPVIGSNPDDGLKIGFVDTYTRYGFERNPFSAQHTFSASYYFATNGYDFNYLGEIANVVGTWNLGVEADFTSPNYSINFFGYGNETINPNVEDEDTYDMDYNRVKLSTHRLAPSLIWRGDLGASFRVGVNYEFIEVEDTKDRFINTFYVENGEEKEETYAGVDAIYNFRNVDNEAFPTLGMEANLEVGYKTNLKDSNNFGYIIPSLAFDYKLSSNGQLVLATKVKGHVTLGDDFEFYQAASLGASDGLRGYRNNRFTGKNAFYQNTDIRLNLRKLKTGLLPLNIGIYGGVDYGRVWVDGEDSDKWNNSVGGGVFFNAADMMTGNISAFNSNDGLRLAFRIGFGF
ncbi:metallophosphoesterase [Pontimicrobium sp. IMCC45349]|uniref:metallophosphoesterase n=1 Tax=Pontimicrobium sp. IMCC45349 TaxID=3391574 RepID=UPI0039A23BBE